MPNETQKAVNWALEQERNFDGENIKVVRTGEIDWFYLVHFVNIYFDDNDIEYGTYRASDLKTYIPDNLIN